LSDPHPAERTPRGRLLIIGAGPAGLTAGFDAVGTGWDVTVLEKDPAYVGGISRTVCHDGYRFDIGGHRFFSKSDEVTQWWKNRLPDDFIQVRRMSRIYYRRKYFDYPLKPWNALSNLRFGRRLFSIFFKTYTEKVWGIPTSELSADWAAQRIKGLSLTKAVMNAFRGKSDGPVIKTLIDTFSYPRLGPGQMWEKTAADIQARGGRILMGTRVKRILHSGGRVTAVEATGPGDKPHVFEADHFIVSMPLREAVLALDPPLSAEAVAAAGRLRYRDFLTVALVVDGENPCPDNWIDILEPGGPLGRSQ
jgi:protoporphyrinogen oxidase